MNFYTQNFFGGEYLPVYFPFSLNKILLQLQCHTKFSWNCQALLPYEKRGKLNMAIQWSFLKLWFFCHPQLNRWNVGQANYIQPLCLIVICLNSTLPTLICNSKWSLGVQTSGRNDMGDRRGRFWGYSSWTRSTQGYFYTFMYCANMGYFYLSFPRRGTLRSSLNNIIMVITESDILWRLKVNPEVFLLQQIPTLWWALWKCTRDVSPLS